MWLKRLTIFTFLLFLVTAPAVAGWAPATRLTSTPGESAGADLALAGSELHLVWYDNSSGDWQIYYKRSRDGGATWTADRQLSQSADASLHPKVAVAGRLVHVVWSDNASPSNTFYRRSADGGLTWSSPLKLTDHGINADFAHVEAVGREVHVIWRDTPSGRTTIYYRRSLDGGLTWKNQRKLGTGGWSGVPTMTMAGRDLHVAWVSAKSRTRLIYRRSPDSGKSWSKKTTVVSSPLEIKFPSIAAAGSAVHLAWSDGRSGAQEIFHAASANAGSTWGAKKRLTFVPGGTATPFMATAGPGVHLAWVDTSPGTGEIYSASSSSCGASWSTHDRMSFTAAYSQFPTVEAAGDRVYLLWEDPTSGSKEIYMRIRE